MPIKVTRSTSRSRQRTKSRSRSRPRASTRTRSSINKRQRTVKYVTLDNGGEPFIVSVQGKNVSVYRNISETAKPEWDDTDPIFSEKDVKEVFPGYDPPGLMYNESRKKKAVGNSVLVRTNKDDYIYIGESVKRFKTLDGELVTDYVSPVGNSAVPYPFAVTNTYVYLMTEGKAIPTTMHVHNQDPYLVYYNKEKIGKAFKMKTEVPRQF